MIKFVFWGTDTFATIVLDELKNLKLSPSLIITTPDKPAGRKMQLTPPPVKIWAQENNIPFTQPTTLKQIPAEFKNTDFDICLVASYGKILPETILGIPRFGFVNIHPSLIPKFRGATPLESAILSGDKKTGVTLMQVDAEMDHGPIIAQEELSLVDQDYITLREQTARMGAKMFADLISNLASADKIIATAQNHSEATYTKKITKADGEIDLESDPIQNFRKIRAYADWPGTYFFMEKDGKLLRIIIKKAHLENNQLTLDRVLPEGKKEIDWETFKKQF